MAQETSDERERRDGRGRLSTIEMMPEEADEHILWANQQLRDRSMPQTEILREFNARLADLGLKPISKGAFSRYSIRVAIEMRKLEASRQITDAVLSRMAPEDRADSTIAAIEMVKFRILSLVMDEEEPDPKLLGQAALALSRLSSTSLREAQGQRLDRRDQAEEDQRRKAAETATEVADAATKIAKEAGISADRIAQMRRDFLGVG